MANLVPAHASHAEPVRWIAWRPGGSIARFVPGILLCSVIAGAAFALQRLEVQFLGRAWLEALVIAILLGAVVRSTWTPGPIWAPGVAISAKVLLETAIVLLGASVSVGAVLAVGPALLAGVAAVVVIAVSLGYGLGRLFGLPHKLATLIACGNAICGNSAIAAVAPAIGAEADDVAASIAFTAVLGVAVVLGLPLVAAWMKLTPSSFGVLAGLTVYAVPQVLAATAPVSALSAQVGTLVKLVRVLMLGPVVLALSLLASRARDPVDPRRTSRATPKLHQMAPWFIIAFLAMMGARSAGWIPAAILPVAALLSQGLTVVSMAALGLGVDVRDVTRAGGRVTSVAILSILGLGLIAMLLIHLLGLR